MCESESENKNENDSAYVANNIVFERKNKNKNIPIFKYACKVLY